MDSGSGDGVGGLDLQTLENLQEQSNHNVDIVADPNHAQAVALDRMEKQDDIIRNHIEDRRKFAIEHERRLNLIVKALKHEGYSQAQINKIFSDQMTPELEDDLCKLGASL